MEGPGKQVLQIGREGSNGSSSTSARGPWTEIPTSQTRDWVLKFQNFLCDENSISKINPEVSKHETVSFRPFPFFFPLHFSVALKSRSSVKSFDQQFSFHLFGEWQNKMKKSSQMFAFKHAEASFSLFSVYFWVSDKILCAPGSQTAFVTRRAILKALYSWFSVSILNYQCESNIFSLGLILTWPQAYNVRRAGN